MFKYTALALACATAAAAAWTCGRLRTRGERAVAPTSIGRVKALFR